MSQGNVFVASWKSTTTRGELLMRLRYPYMPQTCALHDVWACHVERIPYMYACMWVCASYHYYYVLLLSARALSGS